MGLPRHQFHAWLLIALLVGREWVCCHGAEALLFPGGRSSADASDSSQAGQSFMPVVRSGLQQLLHTILEQADVQRSTVNGHADSVFAASPPQSMEEVLNVLLESDHALRVDDSVLVSESLYSLLQLSSQLAETEEMRASQFFELVEEPIMNLVVPVAVSVVISIARIPIIMILSETIAYILSELLAVPLGDALFPGMDTSSLQTISQMFLPKWERSETSVTTTTTTVVEEEVDAFLEYRTDKTLQHALSRVETARPAEGIPIREGVKFHVDPNSKSPSSVPHLSPAHTDPNDILWHAKFGMGIDDTHAGMFLELTQCSAAHTARECNGLAPPTSAGRCSWCAKITPEASVATCLPCDPKPLEKLEQDGFTCSRSSIVCTPPASASSSDSDSAGESNGNAGSVGAASEAESDSDFPIIPPAPKGKTPPNEAAATLAKLVTATATDSLLTLLHNALVPILRDRLRGKIVRGAVRSLAVNVTSDVIHALTQSLSAPLLQTVSTSLTKRIGSALARELVTGLIPTVSQSLSRNPVTDYMCYQCSLHSQYCEACHADEHLWAEQAQSTWYHAEARGLAAGSIVGGSVGDIASSFAVEDEGQLVRRFLAQNGENTEESG